MHAGVERVRGLWIDAALPDHAAESLLQMGGWAAKSVVKVEVAEGGIEVVAPEEAHDPSSEPHAFWITRWTGDLPAGFSELVSSPLLLLPAFSCLSRAGRRFGVAGLGGGRSDREREEDGAQRDQESAKYLVTHMGFVSPLWFICRDQTPYKHAIGSA